MRPGVRVVSLALTVCLGLIAVGLLLSGLPIASAGSDIDLVVEMKAPTYVDVGAAYVVNLSYANVGGTAAPDNWVEVTVPPGTQFVEATYAGGAPRPPDLINGSVLAWTLTPLIAHSTWGHILITLQTEDTLPEGETLTPVAHIATSAPEPDTSNNTVGVTTTVSYMAGSVKQVQVRARQAMPGDVLTYTITINLADQPGVGANGRLVTLTDTLPFSHHVRFLGWSGTLTGTQHDGQMLSWEGRVWPGEPRVLQYRLGVEGVVTPGTVISNVAMLHWTGHQMQLGPVTTVVTLPYGFMGLGPQQGGQLFHRHGVTLTVPPGAISDTTRFQLGPLFTDTSPVGPAGSLLFANRAFELNAYRFGEPVGHFSAPLSITMNYTDTDVAGLKRETLRMFTRSGPEGPWAELDGPTRLMSGTLTFSTTHLSQFALFGEGKHRVYLPLVTR